VTEVSALVRKLPFALAAIIGAGLIAVALAAGQPSAAKAGDELVTIASPALSEAGVERMRADLERASAVAHEIERDALPRLAAIAGDTPRAFVARLDEQAPAFARGIAQLRAGEELGETIVGNLEQRREQFEQAASLPGLGLTLRDAVWGQLAVAVLLVAVGIAGLVRPSARRAAVLLAVGALLVAAPLALDHPAKIADTDALLDSLTPFPPDKVEARADAVAAGRDIFDGFREELLPLAAAKAGTTPEAVAADLAGASPLLSPTGLIETAGAIERFDGLVELSRRIQPRVEEATTLPATTVMWLIIGPGIALAVAGCAGLVAYRQSARLVPVRAG
jgi:hypothetical protein